MKIRIVLATGAFAAGVGFLAVAAALSSSRRHLETTGQRVRGAVVNLAYHPPQTRMVRVGSYCPVVDFTAPGSPSRSFESSFCGYPARYRRGDQVTVLYDPAHPEDARIDDFLQTWGIVLVTAFFGVLALSFGGAVLLLTRRPSLDSPRGSG